MGGFGAIRHGFSLEVPLHHASEYEDNEHDENADIDAPAIDEDAQAEFTFEEPISYSDTIEIDSALLELDADEAYGNVEDTAGFHHEHHETTVESPDDNLIIEHQVSNPNVHGYRKTHKIKGVWSYDKCFPDINDIQLLAAKRHGITPPSSRSEADRYVQNHKLVNISKSPYYIVDSLTHSMPYLVPRAQQLLNTICVNFIDSCQIKGLPLHLPIITSALRTADDVTKLQRGNKNATTNSCHCYGTTVDIAYNKFWPVTEEYATEQPLTRWNEPMKQVLSEVLNDLRLRGKCYVKYERKQGCFHLTCR